MPHITLLFPLCIDIMRIILIAFLQVIFNDFNFFQLFKRLRYEVPKFYHKVSVINGDIEQPDLGISAEDREKLSEEVNVIFHGAATVRFDEKLRIAVGINVLGTKEILKLAKSVKNLKVG